MKNKAILALDVGERRIGVAWADGTLRIAMPLATVQTKDKPIEQIATLFEEKQAELMVVGLPRNQRGEETPQSEYARRFASQLEAKGFQIAFQDESLTSVLAEDELKNRGKPYSKEDIDSLAATLILQDYLEGGQA